MRYLRITTARHQVGAALLTALFFMVVLTMLGVAVFYSTTAEERMARNYRDKEIALQGAEAALNEAKLLITGSYNDTTADSCTVKYALSASNCFINTPGDAFTCNPNTAQDRITVDLYSGSGQGVALGSVDSSASTNCTRSPVIPGFFSSNQPRYLVVLDNARNCGTVQISQQSGMTCFAIIAQARGRLSGTRVNLVTSYTN